MTYNILNGGVDRRAGSETDRLDLLARVIRDQQPDLLALQELRDFHRDGRLARFAERVGMRGRLARSWLGQPVAVLVRPSARVISARPVRRPFHHAALRLVVGTDRGPLTVVGTHLRPYSGGWRRWEAGWLAAAGGPAGRLALLLGDLNSLAPAAGDGPVPAAGETPAAARDQAERVHRLAPAYRTRHLRADGVTVDTRAIATLYDAGFVDLFRRAGDGGAGLTVPTRLGGAEFSAGLRVDYILGTPAVAERTRSCQVVRDGGADRASDHYPLVAELDLSL
ncbi:endonuclease/exonuclease/phosphatase family protein [Solwaraspora sp. WMMD1047]|uniref:endonuclease/exonuclease/phosphatase family protein n=1 Tax=Solwaraspora sp. WMMD1047 TaxID=3016102 RepID=UPI002417BB1E|nr:endonuclease/exonuclease/phosphatase family protein [Solwaraspora sp. WMMD1047]MDG4830154.1 endonuclease/exonuclease/phosphatase family protein [Solwaraspora sp. WMMD1047]